MQTYILRIFSNFERFHFPLGFESTPVVSQEFQQGTAYASTVLFLWSEGSTLLNSRCGDLAEINRIGLMYLSILSEFELTVETRARAENSKKMRFVVGTYW